MEKLEKQPCPFCHKKTLTLIEDIIEIPYFGKVFLMSMQCSSCNYNMADVESEKKQEPCKLTFEITKEEDMNTRVIKSSNATIRIPQLRISVTPGPASIGYISNIEGVLERFEKIIEDQKGDEDPTVKKKAKNLLKKIRKVKWGQENLRIIIEDPTGNSAIISDKTKIEKLKTKR